MINNCEQRAIDREWTLARTNACHLSVINSEMGEIRDELIDINLTIQKISLNQTAILGVFMAIGIAIISLVIKKMWGKK